ncbi:MAG: right-handed parallel beta-helix repeat-containing protein, partial [Myxococcales bacterium]|nr:right-handed parallel beta-helix repeat-containing protein [Myxococcales bacterium]
IAIRPLFVLACLAAPLCACTLSFELPPLDDAGTPPARSCPTRAGQPSTRVTSSAELATALATARADSEILLESGRYELAASLQLPSGITRLTLRGASSRAEDVIIDGGDTVTVGLDTNGATDLLLANLTIQNVTEQAVLIGPGSHRPHICNVHLLNAGLTFISAPDGGSGGSDEGIVEQSLVEYTVASRSELASGISISGGSGWQIRDNIFRNLITPAGAASAMGPAILVTEGARDTIAERNLITNCDRGISFGLYDRPEDHRGGVIRNNVIYRAPNAGEQPDVGIHIAQSPDTKVLHNTVLLSGTYPSAIEYRFAGTTGARIEGNLLDAAVRQRENASATVANNITDASPSWFADPARFDFHLTASATRAIDQVPASSDVPDDIDGDARPRGAASDIGADEF